MNLKDNSERSRWILIIFYLMLAIVPVSLFSNILEYNLLNDSFISEEAAEQNDLRQMVIGMLQVALQICSYIFFIMWFRRAYFNLHAIGRRMEFTEGWAAGAWFVPVLNLVRPYQIMRETWVDTQLEAYGEVQKPTDVVGWWWALFLINNLVANIASRIYGWADTLEAIQLGSAWYIASDLFSIPALLIVIYLIRETSKMERDMYRSNREVAIEDHLI